MKPRKPWLNDLLSEIDNITKINNNAKSGCHTINKLSVHITVLAFDIQLMKSLLNTEIYFSIIIFKHNTHRNSLIIVYRCLKYYGCETYPILLVNYVTKILGFFKQTLFMYHARTGTRAED